MTSKVRRGRLRHMIPASWRTRCPLPWDKPTPYVLLCAVLTSLLLVACTANSPPTVPIAEAPAETNNAPTTPSATADPLPAGVTAQGAYRHVEHLAQRMGTRPSGSPEEADAAEYIAAHFRSYGYNVEKQPFDFEAYRARSATLDVVGPAAGTEQARPVEFSPGGEVTGSLVASGIGRPEELAGGITGQVALIERGTLTFNDKVANAAAAGARGVVLYNSESGDFGGWALGSIGKIPALAVSRETGLRLLDQSRQGGVQVRMNVDASYRRLDSQNVVAKGGDACRVVVGGHYDSVPEGPGANDNASGTAVTLELARALKGRAAADGLCFIAFGSEELGLWGSRRYVASLSDDQKRAMAGMINLDMVGVGDVWRLSGSEDLRQIAQAAAEDAGVPIGSFSAERGRGGSDHAPFIQAGIPALFIHRRDDPNYHTADDKAEFVDPQALEAAGRVAAGVIDRLVGRGSS